MGGSLEDMFLDSSSTPVQILEEVGTTSEPIIENLESIVVETETTVATTTTVSDVMSLENSTTTDPAILPDLSTTTDEVLLTDEEISDLVERLFDVKVVEDVTVAIKAEDVEDRKGETKTLIKSNEQKVSIEKWNSDVNVSVSYEGLSVLTKGENKIANKGMDWMGKEEKVEAYILEPNAEMQDGGVKINVVLNSRPKTNEFIFALDGWQDLDFLYQDSLWKEAGYDAPTSECSDTECTKQNGRRYYKDQKMLWVVLRYITKISEITI